MSSKSLIFTSHENTKCVITNFTENSEANTHRKPHAKYMRFNIIFFPRLKPCLRIYRNTVRVPLELLRMQYFLVPSHNIIKRPRVWTTDSELLVEQASVMTHRMYFKFHGEFTSNLRIAFRKESSRTMGPEPCGPRDDSRTRVTSWCANTKGKRSKETCNTNARLSVLPDGDGKMATALFSNFKFVLSHDLLVTFYPPTRFILVLFFPFFFLQL